MMDSLEFFAELLKRFLREYDLGARFVDFGECALMIRWREQVDLDFFKY